MTDDELEELKVLTTELAAHPLHSDGVLFGAGPATAWFTDEDRNCRIELQCGNTGNQIIGAWITDAIPTVIALLAEVEQLRDVRDKVVLNLDCIHYGSANPDFFLEDSIQRLKATIPDAPPSDPASVG